MFYVIRMTFYVFTLFYNSTLVLKATPFPVHRANFVFGKGVFVFFTFYGLRLTFYVFILIYIQIHFLITNFVILGLSQNRIQYVISRYREIFCHFFSSKKLTKKDLSLIFDGQNKFQPFNVLNHLLRKQ